MKVISQEYLKSLVSYSPLTGTFTWKVRPLESFATIIAGKACNKRYAGKIAGCVCNTTGYLKIGINGKDYQAHRLAWLYMYGHIPVDEIDHISHDRADNRISNLREATRTENLRNQTMSKANKSGHTGVTWNKANSKWQASISVGGKSKHLGKFSDIKDAVCAREKANIKYDFHRNHGCIA